MKQRLLEDLRTHSHVAYFVASANSASQNILLQTFVLEKNV